ncbi:heat domain containing protein [Leptolyngbya sp. Heron Island J]|uniref:heat domain containing protein n=1 Tax=Leptolyngbya sp. Heron Island J TaxID=1385935 RepID=UPI0003B9EDE5|nr:heat domain containing protein [Leptolyngbya sp. Heron Island J]ESA34598.1 heat domain containing protein [Leptolyngbya sp. Heron Island J]
MKAKSSFSLKDQLFNSDKVNYLVTLISQAFPDFAQQSFYQDVIAAFPKLELKERIAHITACLHQHLPDDYQEALTIILQSLPPELDPHKTDDDFGDFIFAPFSLFVALHGCEPEYLNISLGALKEITKRFSAEYAIRYFINTFPDETFVFLLDCASDDNYHVRRWASEGTRSKLPWAQKLSSDYRKPLPILEMLYADKTRYVTRSVANHLNDISKVDPSLVLEMLQEWSKSQRQTEQEMAFITKHALRTLIKQGNQDALQLIGFGVKPDITIKEFSTNTPKVRVGEAFEFSLDIRSNKPQKLLVDYLMHFASNGTKKTQKVFKIKQLELAAGEVVTLKKKHPMRLMTTRRLLLGEHEIVLQINGQAFGSLSFELIEE